MDADRFAEEFRHGRPCSPQLVIVVLGDGRRRRPELAGKRPDSHVGGLGVHRDDAGGGVALIDRRELLRVGVLAAVTEEIACR